MERRPLPTRHAASRPIPPPAREYRAPRPAGPPGAAAPPLDHDGLDPDLRAFLRAPYDPLNVALATRFVARGLLQQTLTYGWTRHFALVVALVLLGTLLASLAALGGLVASGSAGEATAFALQVLILTGPPGAFGAVLFWRLLRG